MVTSVSPDGIVQVPIYYNRRSKQCGLCLKAYSKREFSKLNTSPDGLHYLCRGCWARRTQEKKGLVTEPVTGKERCLCCGEKKDKALFGRDTRLRGGLQRMCRACYAEDHATKPEPGDQTLPVKGAKKAAEGPFLSVMRHGNQVYPEQKKCRDCGKVKESGEFYWESGPQSSLDGRRTICIPCFQVKYGEKLWRKRWERIASRDRLDEGKGAAAKPDINDGWERRAEHGRHPLIRTELT